MWSPPASSLARGSTRYVMAACARVPYLDDAKPYSTQTKDGDRRPFLYIARLQHRAQASAHPAPKQRDLIGMHGPMLSYCMPHGQTPAISAQDTLRTGLNKSRRASGHPAACAYLIQMCILVNLGHADLGHDREFRERRAS